MALPQPRSPVQHNDNILSSQPLIKDTDTLELAATNLMTALDVIARGLGDMPILKLTVQSLHAILGRVRVRNFRNLFRPFFHDATD